MEVLCILAENASRILMKISDISLFLSLTSFLIPRSHCSPLSRPAFIHFCYLQYREMRLGEMYYNTTSGILLSNTYTDSYSTYSALSKLFGNVGQVSEGGMGLCPSVNLPCGDENICSCVELQNQQGTSGTSDFSGVF